MPLIRKIFIIIFLNVKLVFKYFYRRLKIYTGQRTRFLCLFAAFFNTHMATLSDDNPIFQAELLAVKETINEANPIISE